MPPTPYVLPHDKTYKVLTGNHVPPVVDGATNTFWALNAKEGGDRLYFIIFLQPPTGEAREVLRMSSPSGDIGQGKLSLCGGELYATAFRTPDDAVSPPYVQVVQEFVPPPAPPTAGDVLTVLIMQLGKPGSNIAKALAVFILDTVLAPLAAARAALR